jgi:excisionase family DNA binding protein
MSEEVYTVEHAAERLKLHPKTVLRFIRDGRLRATRLGKSYRILRSDLEALLRQEGGAGVTPARSDGVSIRVTAITDIDGIALDRAQRLATVLSAARIGAQAQADPMNITTAYDPARKSLKVVMVGQPDDVASMLRLVQGLAD